MTEVEALEKLLLSRSVLFGEFTLASGQTSRYYIDARKTTMSAEGIRLIGAVGIALIRVSRWEAGAVGGLTMGADPVAYAIARASLEAPPIIDAFSVRKAGKDHGTKRQVEGNFDPRTPVVVVEDVITTGGSTIQAIDTIRGAGGSVSGVIAVVDREQGGRLAIEGLGIEVVSMTTATRLGLNSI
jgi:orotate phosphoribosyltransferase